MSEVLHHPDWLFLWGMLFSQALFGLILGATYPM